MPEDDLFKHCKNGIIKNKKICTVKKNLKNGIFTISWEQKDISQKLLRI